MVQHVVGYRMGSQMSDQAETIEAVLAGEREWAVVHADVLEGLRAMPPESVHCAITSVPYYGLRSYNTEPQVWGGDNPDCVHMWGPSGTGMRLRSDSPTNGSTLRAPGQSQRAMRVSQADVNTCQLCGAWRGELGLEPTKELWIEHMVEVFRSVWRVMRKDAGAVLELRRFLRSRPDRTPGHIECQRQGSGDV